MTYENDYMKVETYTALNPELRINTQFKNILTNYTKSDILTNRFVLLPADYDTNRLLFTKWLHMMNKIIDYTGIQRKKNAGTAVTWFDSTNSTVQVFGLQKSCFEVPKIINFSIFKF